MALKIIKCYLTENSCYKKGKKRSKTKGIVRHSTGADNPNLVRYIGTKSELGTNKYNNDWNRSGVYKCVHFMIGKDKKGNVCCYQTLPLDYCCWGSGKGSKGSYNTTHVQYEILEDDKKDKTYYEKAFAMADELDAYICKKYGLTEKDIVSHNEARIKGYASKHYDCDNWMKNFGDSMDKARARVKKLLNPSSSTSSNKVTLKISNQTVKGVQKWLNTYYNTGLEEDNGYGKLTRSAFIIALKVELKKLGVEVDTSNSTIDGNFKNGIKKYALVKRGKKGIFVTILQALLLCNKIDPNGIDGTCGGGCEDAIETFQRKNSLSVDGCAGLNTWNKILTK